MTRGKPCDMQIESCVNGIHKWEMFREGGHDKRKGEGKRKGREKKEREEKKRETWEKRMKHFLLLDLAHESMKHGTLAHLPY